jgi:hypothetical protein
MTEEQLLQILQAFKAGLEQCAQRIEALTNDFVSVRDEVTEKLNSLETTVFDEIINPANEYIEETNKNARFDEFNSKYGDKFGDFAEPLKALEGDDYDVVREAFNQYDDFEGEKPDEDAYVEALVGELQNKLGQIKSSLGIPEDEEIAVEETEDGGAVVTTEDGEVVASTEDGEEEPEEEPEVEEITDDGEAEDDPEEIAAFEKELEEYK